MTDGAAMAEQRTRLEAAKARLDAAVAAEQAAFDDIHRTLAIRKVATEEDLNRWAAVMDEREAAWSEHDAAWSAIGEVA